MKEKEELDTIEESQFGKLVDEKKHWPKGGRSKDNGVHTDPNQKIKSNQKKTKQMINKKKIAQ